MLRKIPLYSIERIFKELDDFRISKSAKELLKKHIEIYLNTVSKKAVTYSLHAKRKTIIKEDIILALN